ncbi:MAG: winged helix-turn-helix domain-containing protein [Eubacteriales bacterium]|jgi:hypothetical protein
MDSQRFVRITHRILEEELQREGIGTLGEKPLHRIVKWYLEPDNSRHEQPVGPFVGDILREDGLWEIQTGGFFPLRKKLQLILPQMPVTLVIPLAAEKWLRWVDPSTGEVTPRRRSPRKGSPLDLGYQLLHIQPYLTHPHLHWHLLWLEEEEYRMRDGWGNDGKRGSHRLVRVPVGLLQEEHFNSLQDLLPLLLPQTECTVAQLAREGGVSPLCAQRLLAALYRCGLVQRRKEGRSYQYWIK